MSETTKTINDGGPAFPSPAVDNGGRIDYAYDMGFGGMTLRDYFAAKAMQVLVNDNFSVPGCDVQKWRDALAVQSYEIADAMLAARNGSALEAASK